MSQLRTLSASEPCWLPQRRNPSPHGPVQEGRVVLPGIFYQWMEDSSPTQMPAVPSRSARTLDICSRQAGVILDAPTETGTAPEIRRRSRLSLEAHVYSDSQYRPNSPDPPRVKATELLLWAGWRLAPTTPQASSAADYMTLRPAPGVRTHMVLGVTAKGGCSVAGPEPTGQCGVASGV